MSIIPLLATSLGRNDEEPNILLARKLDKAGVKQAKADVRELVDLLSHKDKGLQADAIKVLYELGALKPALIASHAEVFLSLLKSGNNRLQWGAMAALDALTPADPDTVSAALPKILAAADSGSVITRDHAVGILIRLSALEAHAGKAFPKLLERLKAAPENQLPMYAEQVLAIADAKTAPKLAAVLSARVGEIGKESKRKRVEKVLKALDDSLTTVSAGSDLVDLQGRSKGRRPSQFPVVRDHRLQA